MSDAILNTFLEDQVAAGQSLAAQSDLVRFHPLPPLRPGPPDHFVLEYSCKGLVCDAQGQPREHDRFDVGVWYPPDFLKRAEAPQVLTFLGPRDAFHPNLLAPFICLHIRPGTEITSLMYALFELFTYQKRTTAHGLNETACQWARRNKARLPIDPRPLKRAPNVATSRATRRPAVAGRRCA